MNVLLRGALIIACGVLDLSTALPAQQAPGWPKQIEAPKGAPNIVLILVDDVGFSATSTFGGIINTPNFDRLAANGLRYNAFHVNAICSPTRAALLTGRNSHQVGFGTVTDAAAGYPGYNTVWPRSAASIAEVLKDSGYSTAAFGKWHNTPTWESGPTGPFDRWPTGLGFQHFYGFLAGLDNQYYPRLYRDTVAVEPRATPEEGYTLTNDLTTEAIRWLHLQNGVDPEKPFFLYYAPGAVHHPHQVPKEWIEKYQGKFDEGWDKLREETFARQKKLGIIPQNAELTQRPTGLPAWGSLSPQQKRLFAHQAEVYAGFTEQTDHEIGRLLQAIAEEGESENTLVFEIFGDNGWCGEAPEGVDAYNVDGSLETIDQRLQIAGALGGELYMNLYAAGWAWAFGTPFQGAKWDAAHLGGTRDPLVISWPARILKGGGIRRQFQHVTDIAPTIFAATGVHMPSIVNGVKQLPLEGSSLLYTFDHPEEPSHHHVQYFETIGNRAIYKDGWWAANHLWYTWDSGPSWTEAAGRAVLLKKINQNPWELYNLKDDYSQAHDLAARYPEKLKKLVRLFDEEAKRNQVYPLLPLVSFDQQPSPASNRTVFVYRAGVDRLPNKVAPGIVGRRHTITADLEIPSSGVRGVILAQGGRYGGFSLFVKDGHVIYEVNAHGNRSGRLVSKDVLKPGKAHIVLNVMPDRGTTVKAYGLNPQRALSGKAQLEINGLAEGDASFPNIYGTSYTETLDVGSDLGSAVSLDYTSPYCFSGKIDQVKVELK